MFKVSTKREEGASEDMRGLNRSTSKRLNRSKILKWSTEEKHLGLRVEREEENPSEKDSSDSDSSDSESEAASSDSGDEDSGEFKCCNCNLNHNALLGIV
ncbi:hypothetical protein Bbelb_050720 [Branchiostoma belcheri]|nr:hypothetical protein Bbelb_050720 [Branchiostoma belcheri]